MDEAWEQAFVLMESCGCHGAGQMVVDGIKKASSGRLDVVDQRVAIGTRLNAIVEASRTSH